MKKSGLFIVGVDEVGRGPIAGPVAVCAFVLFDKKSALKVSWIKDSKKLSEEKREIAYKLLRRLKAENKADYVVSMRSNKFIDKWGIEKAIRNCIKSCLKKLNLNPDKIFVKLDGRLCAPKEYNQETIVRGDDRIKVISCASVIAKVRRDRLMRKYAKIFPKYGFESNKGYGSKRHYKALKKYGQIEIHRKSFLEISYLHKY